MRKNYPSDIIYEQFELIESDLTSAKKQEQPRKYSLYDIFCAVLYLLKEGCTWQAISHDLPKWQNVRYHYEICSKPNERGISLLDEKIVEAGRESNDHRIQTTMLIVDYKII